MDEKVNAVDAAVNAFLDAHGVVRFTPLDENANAFARPRKVAYNAKEVEESIRIHAEWFRKRLPNAPLTQHPTYYVLPSGEWHVDPHQAYLIAMGQPFVCVGSWLRESVDAQTGRA